MKKTIILLAILFAGAVGYSQEFLGIKVGGTRQEAINKFKAKGFVVIGKSSNTAISMRGKAGENDVDLVIVNSPTSKKVWKFAVFLPERTTWDRLKSDYEYYVNLFTEKLGSPSESYSNFVSPYYEGDGYEMSAVGIDKCNYVAFWDGIYIEITKWKQVSVCYENKVNAEISKKEKDAINSNSF